MNNDYLITPEEACKLSLYTSSRDMFFCIDIAKYYYKNPISDLVLSGDGVWSTISLLTIAFVAGRIQGIREERKKKRKKKKALPR